LIARDINKAKDVILRINEEDMLNLGVQMEILIDKNPKIEKIFIKGLVMHTKKH